MAEVNYKKLILAKTSLAEVDEWLKRNPVPAQWLGNRYAWAYHEMPRNKFYTWFRKTFLGYSI